MSFSFIEIEERTSRSIGLLLAMLVLFYFVVAWLLAIPLNIVGLLTGLRTLDLIGGARPVVLPTLAQTGVALGTAVIVGLGHWFFSIRGMADRVLRAVAALPLDEKDTVHQQFRNIVSEASVAAGGIRIECRVLPTTALNAFAVADLGGRKVVGVTEGLLARLNRQQIEAVVGHEVAHLVSGDSLTASLAASLFGVYAIMSQAIKRMLGGLTHSRRHRYDRHSGGVIVVLAMIYGILAVSKLLSVMLSMLLSRQREYRADAVCVRLTRNPVALAEALHIISRGWRGAYSDAENLESIFIVSPAYHARDEHEGFWADLFSTHPPVRRRIGILLDMARSSTDELARTVSAQELRRRTRRDTVIPVHAPAQRWFLVDPRGEWEGPFEAHQLPKLGWLTAQTWVRRESQSRIQYAWEEPQISALLRGEAAGGATRLCPQCAQGLSPVQYEGVPLLRCAGCFGYLVARSQISRVLARQQQAIPREVERQGRLMRQEKKMRNGPQDRPVAVRSEFVLPCPHCGRAMERGLYRMAYPVEIDLCRRCDIMWFEKNELELLQFLYEEHDRPQSAGVESPGADKEQL